MAGKGILLDIHNQPLVRNGSMVVGDSELQETAIILGMNQGELKTVPVLGADLVQLLNINASKFEIERRARVHLAKDGKDYNALKNKIKTNTR